MSLQYVIDGYNIIHHPIFKKQAGRKAQDKRFALLDLIRARRLCGSAKNKITIVFDGYPPQEASQNLKHAYPVDIIFSRDISADEKIKIIVQESANRKNVTVISDDKEIKFMIRSLGAQHMNIEDFIAPESKLPRIDEAEASKPQLSYTQINKINQELRRLWLKA